jgi:hypothetical protein
MKAESVVSKNPGFLRQTREEYPPFPEIDCQPLKELESVG